MNLDKVDAVFFFFFLFFTEFGLQTSRERSRVPELHTAGLAHN